VEHLIGDWGITTNFRPTLPEAGSKKVAIIGAGPAGLAAAHYLRHSGVNVVLYDENEKPGGILHYGIPSYRLDKDVLKAELDRVLDGVEFKPNMRLGEDFDLAGLGEFDAVFLATGAHTSRKMHLEGEDLPGVESGLGFLKRVNSGESVRLDSKQVLVVGGGNTACDVARTAYRLGGRVTMAYRRTEHEMPAFAEEVEQMKAEPIDLEFLVAPFQLEQSANGRIKVACHRMELGEPDDDGRRRPVVLDGADFDITVDIVFTAIGEEPDVSFASGLAYDDGGSLDLSNVDPQLRDKLFIGGDILPQPRTVPHAVASGRLAADQINAFLKGVPFEKPAALVEVAAVEDINFAYFTRLNAAQRAMVSSGKGISSDETIAIDEANRCLSCGVCFECDNCYNFCPDLAVVRTPGGYQANLDYCKGCGICAKECPSGTLTMQGGRVA
jgi:NADPH-dependent glutamate synthase beta subunit-like oxidoreductase/Pyruvate/2-oxoacid:ferredoxin oxidoreductase delta subunit